MRRRTRIVATLGPATDPPEVMAAILAAGLDVARINFSHGKADEHLDRIRRLREAAKVAKRNVAVLADLPGPKLRVLLPVARPLVVGAEISFSTGDKTIQPEDLTITEPEMLRDVRPGHRILLDDGRLQLKALRFEGERLIAEVVVGGDLKPNKGLNLPDTTLTVPALTARDREAIAVAANAQVDWLALSFVRGPEAATELREEAKKHGYTGPILAKMERPEAVTRADAIIAAFDAIMVARGDLGVEIPLERVPYAQKQLIARARAQGKPVITATDMLDSMRTNPRPTRAEASDVANAIYDGTDAVMLSGETAIGQYPIEAISCMARIAVETEAHLMKIGATAQVALTEVSLSGNPIDDAFTTAAVRLAIESQADAIITPTLSGRTARLLARHRPICEIIAPAPSLTIVRQMAMLWGTQPVLMPAGEGGDDRIQAAVKSSFDAGAVSVGQRVVVFAGHPIKGGNRFPTLRLVKVGDNGVSLTP